MTKKLAKSTLMKQLLSEERFNLPNWFMVEIKVTEIRQIE